MKLKLSLFFLLAFSIAVFFAGWVQFSVPAGKYGVLVSKTGGFNPSPIKPGRFRWQWECLLPTNARVIIFDLSPVTVTASSAGTLPSGDVYSKMLEGDPDFSWSVGIKITGRIDPERLPTLVRDASITEQTGLDAWTKARLEALATESIAHAMSDLASNGNSVSSPAADTGAIVRLFREALATSSDGEIEVLECVPAISKVPDIALYALASRTYADYQAARSELFAKTSAEEADASVSEYLEIERFGRWGELLTKYPILIDFLAVSKVDAGQAFKAVRELSVK